MNKIILYLETLSNGGFINIFLFLLLCIISIIGFTLGIFSILKSKLEQEKLPLEFKLSTCFIILTIIIGVMSLTTGFVDGFASLATSSNRTKADLLKMTINIAFGGLLLACLSAFIQFILLSISCIIIQSREKSPINLINKIISLPKTIILITPLILIGVGIPIYQIYDIVTLKPDETPSLLLGMEATNILYICFIASIIGLISIFVYFLSSIINKIKNLKGD